MSLTTSDSAMDPVVPVKASVQVCRDGTATIDIPGRPGQPIMPQSGEDPHPLIAAALLAAANELGQPLEVVSIEPDGQVFVLLAGPGASRLEVVVDPAGTPSPPPEPEPKPEPEPEPEAAKSAAVFTLPGAAAPQITVMPPLQQVPAGGAVPSDRPSITGVTPGAAVPPPERPRGLRRTPGNNGADRMARWAARTTAAPAAVSPVPAPVPEPAPARPPRLHAPAPAPVPDGQLPTLADLRAKRTQPRAAPPSRGWQGIVYRCSAGLVSPSPSERELHLRSCQRAVTRSLEAPRTVVFANGKGGAPKCLVGETPIVDPISGRVVRLDEVMADPALGSVLTLADRRTVLAAPIAAKVDNGVRETLRIRFASGRELTVTPNHPLLTPDGWQQVRQLTVGTTVAGVARIPAPLQPRSLPGPVIDLIAILLAEGCYTEKAGQVSFSTADPEILRRTHVAAETLGMKVRHRAAYDYALSGRGEDGRSRAKQFLLEYGMPQTTSHHKRIPDVIFSLPDEQLARFLAVFWMCDGFVGPKGPGVTLASRGLVADLQHLLLRFGIQSTQNEFRSVQAWKVNVLRRHWQAFADQIPLWDYKADALAKLVKRQQGRKQGHSINGLPVMTDRISAALREIAPRLRRSAGEPCMREVADKLGWGVFQFDRLINRGTRTICPDAFRAFCEVFGVTDYDWLWSPDLFWERIVAIEAAGARQVYDLTVDPTHCFLAADLVVHNTSSAVAFAAAVAAERGGDIVLWDNNPFMGNLAVRAGANNEQQRNTVVELLRDLPTVDSRARLNNYLRTVAGQHFTVLAATEDPNRQRPITGEDFAAVHRLLARWFSLIIVDSSNDISAPNFRASIEHADQVVVPLSLGGASIEGGGQVLAKLQSWERTGLARQSVAVMVRANTGPNAQSIRLGRSEADELYARARTYFAPPNGWARAFTEVPPDPVLAFDRPIEYGRLSRASRDAWLETAAAVFEGL